MSTDSIASHEPFAREEQLPFPLLSDPDERIIRAYGVSSTLSLAHRMTYIINGEGRIARVFPDVDPGVHASEVIEALEEMRVQ